MFNLWQALFFSSEDEAMYDTGLIPRIKDRSCWYRVRVKIVEQAFERDPLTSALFPQNKEPHLRDIYHVTVSKMVQDSETEQEHEYDPHVIHDCMTKVACEEFLTEWHIPVNEEYWSAVENWSMGREE